MKHCNYRKIDFFVMLLLFALAFSIYVHSLFPGLLFVDCAEFQTLAATLGMTHPTGYPVYLLIAKLFTFIPVNSIAYRVNMVSAFFGASTIAVLYPMFRIVTDNRIAAVSGALVILFCRIFWAQSIIAEVYAAASFFIALILLFILKWNETKKVNYLFCAGLLGGMSLGIHLITLLIIPAVFTFLLISHAKWKDWIFTFAGALSGMGVFILSILIIEITDAPSSYYYSVIHPSISSLGMSEGDFSSVFTKFKFVFTGRQLSSNVVSSY